MIKAKDSKVKPKPIKIMAWSQLKKRPIPPEIISTNPKVNKEIIFLFMWQQLFSVNRNQIRKGIIKTETHIVKRYLSKSGDIKVHKVVWFC